jgi:flavin reductase (DIM6/NTAB) family NADH-FMN oxidoreductase RutF
MFKNYNPTEYNGNPFDMIGKQWMLITAVRDGKLNTMTASWGGMGVLWHKPVATIYIRPPRYTHDFVEAADRFTLSFLPETYREALNICGKQSGRDIDKLEKTGLVPVFDNDIAWFKESELVCVCRKLYRQTIDPNGFIDRGIDDNYPQKDYHTVFIGEIEQWKKPF